MNVLCNIIRTVVLCLILFAGLQVQAQQSLELSGKVLSSYNSDPLEGAIVSVRNEDISTRTNAAGEFTLTVNSLNIELLVWSPGYYESVLPVLGRDDLTVVLIPENRFNYNALTGEEYPGYGNAQSLYQGNFRKNALYVEDVIQGVFPGLNVLNKSGMPGEGSLIQFRGIRSFEGQNTPLIVINGVPYLSDMENSSIIGGYSKSILNPLNVNDVKSIRFLSGPETALYGSMGSNGVLLIETSTAEDMETVIEFSGQYGMAYNRATLPVLGVHDFKSYIGDVGLTEFEDMGEMLGRFPFLKDDPDYYYNFLYNENTDWQSLIYRPAFVTDNNLRVKGGDAIAKYDLSAGVLNQGGVVDNSNLTRFSTRLNATIALGRKINLFASVGLSYLTGKLHEQGMLKASNPVLAALNKAPILSPYTKDEYNNQLPTYDVVRQFGVSNPLAVINTTSLKSDIYDVSVNAGMNYQASDNLTITGLMGIYSNYNRQSAFIPGMSSGSILPLENGIALNSARAGSGQVSNIFYNINAQYAKSLGQDEIRAGLGYQGLLSKREFDSGSGRNTSSDFYKTLSYVSHEGRSFWGYIDVWNWMSAYGYANYHYRDLLTAALYLSVDGASSTGENTGRFGAFPGGSLTWHIHNTGSMKASRLVNSLNLHAGYFLTGNSRFSSNLSKQYYGSQVYRQLSGIVVGNVPNTSLHWENNYTLEAGLEVSMLNNRLSAALDYYSTISRDLVLARQLSPVFGTGMSYLNAGEISNKGLEISLQAALVEKKDFGLSIGGSLNRNRNLLESLGGETEKITELSDGSALISRVGSSPYSFYGHVSQGVIPSQAEAESLQLVDYKGTAYQAGDVHFKDIHSDGIIDDRDRTVIGDASPDFFGGFFLNTRYKKLSLTGYFSYSYGNQAYNALRRNLESISGFSNQSEAITRRWQTDGHITDVPRAVYGDPMQNSRFSDRWIEDASFLRLANLTISYRIENSRLKWFEGAEIYLTGENLFTITEYLGLDPVTAYSYNPMMLGFDYGNVALPTTFKMGFNLLF